MFKMMITGRRRAGQTLAAHRHHMRFVHAPLVLGYIAAHPDMAPQRYVQNHAYDGTWQGAGPIGVARDFVTEISFASPQAAAASVQTPYYLTHLQGDEANMVDQASVILLPAVERLRLDGVVKGAAHKVFVLLTRAEGVDPAAFRAAWQDQPSPVAAQRHVQNDIMARPGEGTPVDGVDEVWFTSQAEAEAFVPQPGPLMDADKTVIILAWEYVLHAGQKEV